MKKFHVVFRLRVEASGTLVFWDDDGCIIRRDGEVVHEDRQVHALERHELAVRAGDLLEIAKWQYHGDWIWAGRIEPAPSSIDADIAFFDCFRGRIGRALAEPNGPALKVFINAATPVRTALALHSVILNGYRPERVLVVGDYQWGERGRRAIEALLPFAEIVPVDSVLDGTRALEPGIVPTALACWAAMKICVCLFHPPLEYGFVDDDVFVLDRMDEALSRFSTNEVVYAPDADCEWMYRVIWRFGDADLKTGNINTGVHFLRNTRDRRAQAARIANSSPDGTPVGLWEQGFFATEFVNDRTSCLPIQTYFYPFFDGLPGGHLGYDWARNPCGFVTVHFGGLPDKPTDDDARVVVRDILNRHRTRRM
jgi:hypothetical protein